MTTIWLRCLAFFLAKIYPQAFCSPTIYQPFAQQQMYVCLVQCIQGVEIHFLLLKFLEKNLLSKVKKWRYHHLKIVDKTFFIILLRKYLLTVCKYANKGYSHNPNIIVWALRLGQKECIKFTFNLISYTITGWSLLPCRILRLGMEKRIKYFT